MGNYYHVTCLLMGLIIHQQPCSITGQRRLPPTLMVTQAQRLFFLPADCGAGSLMERAEPPP